MDETSYPPKQVALNKKNSTYGVGTMPTLCVDCRQFNKQKVTYRKTSNISRILVDSTIVDNSDVVGASPVGAAPTTSSFST